MDFLPSTVFFQNQLFRKKLINQEHYQSVKQIDSDQTRRFIGSDLGPNFLQRLSTDNTRWQRVNLVHFEYCGPLREIKLAFWVFQPSRLKPVPKCS